MEKLSMCRICLVENVQMYVIANKNLQEIYEKLTDISFMTEDSRPKLVCFFCCTKLKQCAQMQKKCLEAEELFAQMLNEDYKRNPLLNQSQLKFCCGYKISPIEHVSIIHEFQAESYNIKDELPDNCAGQDDIIEPKEEHQSDELELECQDAEYLDSLTDPKDMISDHSESGHIPPMVFKTEVEREHEIFKKKQRAKNTEGATVAKKPRRAKLEDTTTAEQKKNQPSGYNFIQTVQNRASKYVTKDKEPVTTANTTVTNRNIDKSKEKLNNPNITELTNNIRNKKVIKNDDVNTHQGLCIGETIYKCDICSRGFTTKYVLKRHMNIHTGEKRYKCDVCQRSFTQNSDLNSHIRQHTGEKPYKCDICQKRFIQKNNLKNHILTHTGEKPYKCDVCQRSFALKQYLNNHNRKHTGEKPYKCDICSQAFTSKYVLKRHIYTHTGEKPYKCDICHRSFNFKFVLDKHIQIHTGEKPYKCDICHRSFNLKSAINRHIRTHTDEKPYKCDVCQRSFALKQYLNGHIRIHTREKPYKSDVF